MSAAGQDHCNRTWDELRAGEEASIEHAVTERDLYLFAHASGNLNPLHTPGTDVDGDGLVDTVAPSMWLGALVSTVLGNALPGPGTLYRAQQFDFAGHARVGDRLRVQVRVLERLERPRVLLETRVSHADGRVIAQGRAEVDAPTERIVLPRAELPGLMLDTQDHFVRLIGVAASLPPLPTAVVWPDDEASLAGTLLAARRGLIRPVFVGSATRIAEAARAAGLDISGIGIIDIALPDLAAARAVMMVQQNSVRAIMKGSLHSDELLAHIVKKDGGLRSGRRISHVFALDVPTLEQLLFISDAAINIAPDLATKVDIVQNAIDLARACGLVLPRVGVLSAVETVNLNIPSSMDAAVLAKMAERGQITGGVVDGPLAMDNAMSAAAARSKKLLSPVAGRAQVLVVPNLEAGNMLAKQLTFVSGAEPAGLVLGAQVPVMLTSRADNERARLASCALALLYEHFRRTGKPAPGLADAAPAA